MFQCTNVFSDGPETRVHPFGGKKTTREDFLYLLWPTRLNKGWVTGRFSETGSVDATKAAAASPPLPVSLCAAGLHRPSSSWPHTEGALQLT